MSAAPSVTVLYFAWLRERIGTGQEQVVLPPGTRTVGELLAVLRGQSDRHAASLADTRVIRCAVNQEFASPDAPVSPGDEVAFFPPVTGG